MEVPKKKEYGWVFLYKLQLVEQSSDPVEVLNSRHQLPATNHFHKLLL